MNREGNLYMEKLLNKYSVMDVQSENVDGEEDTITYELIKQAFTPTIL